MKTHLIVFVLAILFSACQDEKTFFVADHFGSCEEPCLLVRENENLDWINFSNKIEGFDYELGYEYLIKVKVEKNDTSSDVKYTLIELVSKTKTETKTSIDNSDWIVSEITGFVNKTDKSPDFSIKEGSIQGNSGCNTFGGDFQSEKEGAFKTGMLRITKMYCEAYMDLEKAFTGALNKASQYQIDGERLQVLDHDGELLFTASRKLTPKTLEQKWFVSTIKGFNNTTDKIPYFTIKSEQINGSNGCNSFGGGIETDSKGHLKVGMLRVTKMYCEQLASLEKAFHEALGNAVSYKITDDTLFLLDKSNYVLISATTEKFEETSAVSPYIIEYNTYSRTLAIRNKVLEEKNVMYYHDLRPEKTDQQKVVLSKSELKFFKDALDKIDFKEIENIKPPSTKHQHDGAAGATIIVSFKGKSYRVPTFDHGNPPAEVKDIVDKIMALRSK